MMLRSLLLSEQHLLFCIVMMNELELVKGEFTESCVRIFIHCISEPFEYDSDSGCETKSVMNVISEAFQVARGHLTRRATKLRVGTTILNACEYDVHIDLTKQQQQAV
jgi:hypothetical protein